VAAALGGVGKEGEDMLTNAKVMATLPVVDVDRARRFYGETLGLQEAQRFPDGGVIFRTGAGSEVELYPREQPTKADHTAMTFAVQDLEREIRELEGRGVRFEDYDLPGLKTEGHVATMKGDKAAWFKDPDGNILCLHQPSS
jgi:catechol 2,3-dioxygenase-like lactoylglutathione lyase family enzyme